MSGVALTFPPDNEEKIMKENIPTELQVILGGVTVAAKLRDGSTEEVKVRQLPIRIITTDWAKKLGDQAELVELYCDKPAGWDDGLLPESHDEIIAIGKKLNFPLFARWKEEQRATVEEINAMSEEAPSKGSSTTVA